MRQASSLGGFKGPAGKSAFFAWYIRQSPARARSVLMPPPLVFPRHRYLGPGNDLDSGEPVDEDDRIAQRHDYAYAEAVSAEDILRADEHAIEDFWNDFASTGNFHSLAGKIKFIFRVIINFSFWCRCSRS